MRDVKIDSLSEDKKKWLQRFSGEFEDGVIGECTMPGCKNVIYDECEYYKDDSGNVFCSTECVFEWYGIEKVE